MKSEESVYRALLIRESGRPGVSAQQCVSVAASPREAVLFMAQHRAGWWEVDHEGVSEGAGELIVILRKDGEERLFVFQHVQAEAESPA